MKRAKKRIFPVLAILHASTRRAARAMAAADAAISASNEGLARKRPRYTLAELLAESPGGHFVDKDWDQAPPVGRELL